jgi:hypothetical protein
LFLLPADLAIALWMESRFFEGRGAQLGCWVHSDDLMMMTAANAFGIASAVGEA